jgi:ABC-type dipeptide/oligopeptide/nickel transport system permease component
VFREAGVSATLGFSALMFAVPLGLIIGMIAAFHQNTRWDYCLTMLLNLGYGLPNFVAANLLILLTVTLLYQVTGGQLYEELGWGKPQQLLVPAISLGLHPSVIIGRMTRASTLEVIKQDYVVTAWAKGLAGRTVAVRHALRNALIPVVTLLGPIVTTVLTGSVVIENIFGIPGLGKEFTSSILGRDYQVTIGVFTAYALLIGLATLLVDVSYPILDPRIRY